MVMLVLLHMDMRVKMLLDIQQVLLLMASIHSQIVEAENQEIFFNAKQKLLQIINKIVYSFTQDSLNFV